MKMISNKLICLGLEGTAHTFSAGVVTDNGEILTNILDMYRPKKGGLVPLECAEHHKNVSERVIQEALEKARIKMEDVDIIAYSAGPGLPPSLRATAKVTENLAIKYNKPMIPVNHSCAHLEIAKLTTGAKDPVFLYCSGGNTAVISYVEGRYRIFGEVQDVPIGNALDQFAREADLDFPGGPKIEQLAKAGKYIRLPYTVKGMDLSFSGIITEALRQLKKSAKLEDVCFSLQETAFAMLVEVTERAAAHTGKNEILLTGGVAANKRLQEMLEIMCKERGAIFFTVPKEYAGDNGAQIAWTGLLAYKSGEKPVKKAETNSRWRTDEVDAKWMRKK